MLVLWVATKGHADVMMLAAISARASNPFEGILSMRFAYNVDFNKSIVVADDRHRVVIVRGTADLDHLADYRASRASPSEEVHQPPFSDSRCGATGKIVGLKARS
jgi:hypothetical protein